MRECARGRGTSRSRRRCRRVFAARAASSPRLVVKTERDRAGRGVRAWTGTNRAAESSPLSPRLRRVSSIKKAPSPHRGNREWGEGCTCSGAHASMGVLMACVCGHVRTTRGKSEGLGRLPKAGGWDGREKGERRAILATTRPVVKPCFARIQQSGGMSTYLARASHARACRPYRTRVR